VFSIYRHCRRQRASGVLLCAAVLGLLLTACGGKSPNQAPPPQEVTVIQVAAHPLTVNEEYPAQTEAVDTVEIRARVSGVLERQAYVDGSQVKKDELLFVIDQQPYISALAQANAALAQARATHANSRQILERIRPLLADQAISQQDLDAAIAKEAADAALEEAAQAQVRTAELNLGYTTIRASRDGVISKALIKPGGLVNASTTLLTTLYSIDPVYVNFTISEQRFVDLKKQLGVEKGKVPAYRLKLVDGSDYQFAGRLNFIDAAIDPRNGTLQLRLSVPNPDKALRAGQFIRVVVPVAEYKDAIRVPQEAVQEIQGKRSVFVVGADGKVAPRQITALTRVDNDWVVEGGLAPGDTVIVQGINKVRPGMAVKPVPASAPAADGGAAPKPGPAAGKAEAAKSKD
jgi:membrane fusion protein (multidrug efflux system)